jgi:general secretion pathway protein B
MSYILDALKRADAERERGAAPGLHTRHQVPAGGSLHPARTAQNLGLAAAGGLVLIMLALFYWVVRAPEQAATAPSATSAPAAVPAPNTTTPAAPALVNTPPAAITPMAPPPAVVAEVPKVQALPDPAASAAKAVAAPAAMPASQTATSAAVPLLAELPPDLRSQIPKIAITGSVYSNSPAQRLLLINNLVLTQGSQVTPDLTLEEIQPRSSVFNFKGTRFKVMH